MAGIQISGLVANSAFDWKSVVDQLIAADSAPITKLNTEKTTNLAQVTALTAVNTSMADLQSSLEAIRSGDLFSLRNVSSDTTGTTWVSNSASGAAIGAYTFDVSHLATAAQVQGSADIGSGLSPTNSVTGLTVANLRTATAINAGTFTVNGQQVTVALTDSLQDVFNNIAAATATAPDGAVTASYDHTTDTITLSSAGSGLVLGAANDTSNFLQAMKLGNSGGTSTSSFASLGVVSLASPLISSGLKTPITAVDSSGNGTFSINGVAINYNVNTDTLGSILSTINQSGAGVNATFDSLNDRVVITNGTTGDVGLGLNETSGGLLGALGVAGGAGTFVRGNNAQFTLNGGPPITSTSNTLDSSVTGITGLSVTVNSQMKQTVTVSSDTTSMQTAVQTFIDKFNALQDLINTDTQIQVSGSTITTAVLSGNHEVEGWAAQLQSMAFDVVTGATGSVQRLDNLGIDFNSTSGHLTIKNTDALTSALANHPDDVKNFFLTPTTGLVPKMFDYLNNLTASDNTQQGNLSKANSDLDTQISTLQARLDDERSQLTTEFTAMLDAQSAANSQNQTLTSAFFNNNNNNNNSCWVARAVYGAHNPRWLVFRFWLLQRAPAWFRWLYLRYGARVAAWLGDKPRVKAVVRRWMEARIASLTPL